MDKHLQERLDKVDADINDALVEQAINMSSLVYSVMFATGTLGFVIKMLASHVG